MYYSFLNVQLEAQRQLRLLRKLYISLTNRPTRKKLILPNMTNKITFTEICLLDFRLSFPNYAKLE